MKIRLVLLLFILFFQLGLLAQNASTTYWVKLKDKKGSPFQITHPETFLSQRSIDRRRKQGILIDETDFPVSPVYLNNLKILGAEVVHASKWLNGVTVRILDTTLTKTIRDLPFVKSVQLTKPAKVIKSAHLKFYEPEENADISPARYGNAYTQLSQLNGQYLHNKGL